MVTPRHPKKSTNGRFVMRALEAIAPAWVEQQALKAFCTPRRPRTPRVPTLAGARPFELEAAGERLRAWEWGEGPTVLLIHGWSGYAAQMQRFVPPLLARGHHVVTVDLPAHGQSEGQLLTLPKLAASISALIQRLQPTAVIAHSFGAAATTLALHDGAQVDKFVLVGTPVEMEIFARRSAARAGLSNARADGMIRIIEGTFGSMSRFDLRQLAPQVRVPAVIVHDEDDEEVDYPLAEQLAAVWPGAALVTTTGLGHLGHLKSAEFCEATASWVTGRTSRLMFAPDGSAPAVSHAPRSSPELAASAAR